MTTHQNGGRLNEIRAFLYLSDLALCKIRFSTVTKKKNLHVYVMQTKNKNRIHLCDTKSYVEKYPKVEFLN